MGYKNILLYAEGLAGWSKAGLPLVKDKDLPRPEIPLLAPSKVQEQLSDVYLVDYRPEVIYKQGHITGSHNIPSHQFSRRYQEIPMNKKIILVDVVGNPAWTPMGWFLKSKGYDDVMMLKGGMNAWQKEGLPLEK